MAERKSGIWSARSREKKIIWRCNVVEAVHVWTNIWRRMCKREDQIIFQHEFETSQRKSVATTSEESLQQENETENEAISRI